MPATWSYPGSRWWRFDFHTHTPASKDTYWAQNGGALTPEQWLLRYMEAGVDCVAITDHNSGAWIDKLKEAYASMQVRGGARFRELYLFPGVEISVNGGFHLLAVLDTAKATSDIDTLLGAVGYDGTRGDSDSVTRKAAPDVLDAVIAAGGLAIPAHVDQPKGLLQLSVSGGAGAVLDANTLRQVLEGGPVLAMELVDRNAQMPQIYLDSKCGWTEILGSDCHNFQGPVTPGSRFTWIKMAKPSLEGLRLALLDGAGFSVRRSDEPEGFDPLRVPEHFITSVEISNARYMGRGETTKLVFSPWFNALVGGRGTGKSTVIHGIRLAYRRDDELKRLTEENETRRVFDAFKRVPRSRADQGGLHSDTDICVTLQRDGLLYRLTWRQDATGNTVEEDLSGSWQPSASQAVTAERFPVRIFSQGQIAALAGESQESLLGIIDDAAGTQEAKQRLEDAKRHFLALRAQGRELEGKLKNRDALQVLLDDVNRKLSGFEGKEHAEILRRFQLRLRQERAMEQQLESCRALGMSIEDLATQLVPGEPVAGAFDADSAVDRTALTVVGRLHDAVAKAANAVRTVGDTLTAALTTARSEIEKSDWHSDVGRAKAKYAELVSELKEQGVADPSEYGKLVEERQRIERELSAIDALRRERDKVAADSDEQRNRVRTARQDVSRTRSAFLSNRLAQNLYVRIDLVPYGRDALTIERAVREALGVTDDRFADDILVIESDELKKGLVVDLLSGLPIDGGSAAGEVERRLGALADRFAGACLGQPGFGGHFNNYLQRECAKRPELLDRLLVWSPDDALAVEYSPRGNGEDFRPIGQASAGQRSAAMLAFLLAHGVEPLVLDQPEDDLDNHLIYDLVVQQIRVNKLRRQLIVVTHNPNIVVNGDAELLYALDFRGGQCRVLKSGSGSLQEVPVREEVCRVMEGGREAFERRYRRLGTRK